MTDASSPPPPTLPAAGMSMRSLVLICYALFLAACFNGVTALIGVIIAYIKRPDAAGSPWASHFDNMIVMFWVALIAVTLGWMTVWFLLGFVIWFVLAIWYLYRGIRGLLRAVDDRPY